MRRVARFAGVGAVVGGMALAAVISVNAQRGPMGGGGAPGGVMALGMMLDGSNVESSWAVISFDVGASDEAVIAIRKLYQNEWDAVAQLRNQMSVMDMDGRREAMSHAQESHAALLVEAKAHLTTEQALKLDEWRQEQANRRQQWQRRALTGGGGGGRRGR